MDYKKYIFNKDGKLNKNFSKAKKFEEFRNWLNKNIKEGSTIHEKLYLYYYDIKKPTCECGKYTTFLGFSKGYRKFCSNKCGRDSKETKKKYKETCLKKYGVESTNRVLEIKNKKIKTFQDNKENHKDWRKTNLKRYGYEYPLQRKEIQEKIKQTKLKKYGDKNYNNTEKAQYTCLKKYGVTSVIKDEEYKKIILKKRNKTKKENFYNKLQSLKNVSPLFEFNKYISIHYSNKYKWKCSICDTIFYDDLYAGRLPRCPKCHPKYQPISRYETEIYNWLKSINIDNIIRNDRKLIKPKEIDIYLPDYKLAIEFNGLYWHSVEYKFKWYHQMKIELCFRKGIRLLYVWENEWKNNTRNVKQYIQYYLNNIHKQIKVKKPILLEIENHKIWY